jgi:Transposase DDE domain
MARSITAAVARIKSEVADWLTPETIGQVCREVGHTWRDRLLNPITTVQLFALQILHGNTSCAHVVRLGGVDCSGEAYRQARARLPLVVLERLLDGVVTRLRSAGDTIGLWRGHRTLLMDGSTTSMPDTPALQQAYGQHPSQAAGLGFPALHVLALFDAATGFLRRLVATPWRTHEMSQVGHVHPEFEAGDIALGDRAFCSFAHLALLAARQVFGLFRLHQRQIADFTTERPSGGKGQPTSRWLKRLGRDDQWVEYVKPKTRPVWLDAAQYAALPATLIVRELRYRVAVLGWRTRTITLVTTLLDPERYPATALAELYQQRWQVETNFRHLKTTLHMDVLRTQTVAGVQKELTVYALVYNLVRLVMRQAAQHQRVPIDRVSFVDAVRWLDQAIAGDPAALDLRINPLRPHRYEPRAIKRRPKPHDLLNVPRAEARQRLRDQSLAA